MESKQKALHWTTATPRPIMRTSSLASLALIGTLFYGVAEGDVIVLKDGGQLTAIQVNRGSKGEYIIRTEEGALLTLERSQVRKVVQIRDNKLEYQQRSRAIPDTVEAHHQLADWCRKNRLSRERKKHFQRVLELEPNDEVARSSLGYQQHKGRWLTRDEIMRESGLVMFEGDYRTPQEIAILKRRQARAQVENDWNKQLRFWRRKLDDDDRDADDALSNIQSITDPAAAPALIQLLEKEKDLEIQRLYLSVLGELRSAAAIQKLVDLSIYDSSAEIREMCLESLMRNHQPLSLTPYTKALKSRDNEIILRAAEALEQIGDKKAISPLIDALVTTHKYTNPNAAPGQMSASFDPSGRGGGGLAMGGKPKVYEAVMQNREVRRALVELSGGHDYDYNQETWRRWYVNTQIHDNVDTRRDE